MKLHLPAVAPNEGARIVGRHLAEQLRRGGDLRLLAYAWDVSVSLLQRIVEDGVEPGRELGTTLAIATGVRARDFKREAQGWWFDAAPADLVAA